MLTTCVVSGNEDALKVLVQRKEALSNADSKGWTPLHEAAVQHKRSILEITYAGPRDSRKYLWKLISSEKNQNCERDVELIIHNCEEKKGELYCMVGLKSRNYLFLFFIHCEMSKSLE